MAEFETKKRSVRVLQDPSGEWRISGVGEPDLIGGSSRSDANSDPIKSLLLGAGDTASAVTTKEFWKDTLVRSALPVAGCGVGGALGAVIGAYSGAGVGAIPGAATGCELGAKAVGAVVLADAIYGVTNTVVSAANSGANALHTTGEEQDEWSRQFGRELAAIGIALATRRKGGATPSSRMPINSGIERQIAGKLGSKELFLKTLESHPGTTLSNTLSSRTTAVVRRSLTDFPRKSKFRTDPQDIETAIELEEHNEITTGVREYLERVGGKNGAQALVPIFDQLLGSNFYHLQSKQLQALQSVVMGFTPTELQYLSLNLRIRIKSALTFTTNDAPLSVRERAALERVDFSLNLPEPFRREYDEPRRDILVERLSTDHELKRIEKKMRADPGRYNTEEHRVRYLRRTVELACEVYEIPVPNLKFYEEDKIQGRKGLLGLAWTLRHAEANDRGAILIAVKGGKIDDARQLALPWLMETALHEFRHILQSHLEKQTYQKFQYASQIRDILKSEEPNQNTLGSLTGFLFRYSIEKKTPENTHSHWPRYRRTFIERDAREFSGDVMLRTRRAQGDMRSYSKLTNLESR